ncbi:DUF167 domain-containing protein [Minwuia sp.]|uniref:DUF167 domain-containing protein n=1 Tax=Minwuia sp. TaxID=2493630 RepID=UPI003A8FAC0B
MPDAVRLELKVTPGARANSIDGWQIDADGKARLKVAVTAAPEKDKANRAVVKLIAKTLKVAPGTIEVVRGETARLKTLQFAADPIDTAQRITQTFGEPAA